MDTPTQSESLEQPPLSAAWSIGEPAFAAVVVDARAIAPKVIVELGSGASSVRLAKAFPHATVLAIESGAPYCEQTRALAFEHGVDAARLRVEHRPLRYQRHGLGLYESYAPGPLPASIDVAIIDGPPHWTKRGREACLYQLAPHLRVGARVYLDDYARPAEQRMARNWLAVYGDALAMRSFDVGHGVCVLEVRAELRARFDPRVGFDAWQCLARRALQRIGARARGAPVQGV